VDAEPGQPSSFLVEGCADKCPDLALDEYRSFGFVEALVVLTSSMAKVPPRL
jgi:hypothetical protein